jgi:hypothetical protein
MVRISYCSMRWWWSPLCNRPTCLDFYSVHWNSPGVELSLHSDTLLWFRLIQFLLFLINYSCSVVEAANTHFIVFVLTRDLNLRSTAFMEGTLTFMFDPGLKTDDLQHSRRCHSHRELNLRYTALEEDTLTFTLELEPTIYCIQGWHANLHTGTWTHDLLHSRRAR